MNEQQLFQGKVKWFNRKRGHGFIVADDSDLTDGRDVHIPVKTITFSGPWRSPRPEQSDQTPGDNAG